MKERNNIKPKFVGEIMGIKIYESLYLKPDEIIVEGKYQRIKFINVGNKYE